MSEINERPVCHRAEDLVTFLYNEASSAERQDFADHAAQCDACRAELTVFRDVHESILTWRNEALGSVSTVAQGVAYPAEVNVPAQSAQNRRKPSALAALRESFGVSPLWLRGATAFAALLLCVLALVVISRSLKQPAPVAQKTGEEKLYTQKQLDDAVKQKLAEQQSQKSASATTANENAANPPVSQQPLRNAVAKNSPPRHSQRGPGLTRAEREQLAADLRLIPGREDEELPFVFSEEPDQR